MPAEFSVIVCSRNRSVRIPNLLDSFGRIDYDPGRWQLVFVDNASTDETKDVFFSHIKRHNFRFSYVYAPLAGLARARNAGAADAVYSVLCFTDDDCYPDASWLAAYSNVFADEHIGFAGGMVRPYSERTAKLSLQTEPRERTFEASTYLPPGALHGANIAVRADVLGAVGGFDPLFGAGAPLKSADDTELLARVLLAGYRGQYAPSAAVQHDHDRTTPAEVKAVRRGYDLGRGAYFYKMLRQPSGFPIYSKAWRASALTGLRNAKFGRIFRELRGAITYRRLARASGNDLSTSGGGNINDSNG